MFPNTQEKYYLRMLLQHVRGAMSYQDLRTVNEHVYPTFQAAARALNLLASDE